MKLNKDQITKIVGAVMMSALFGYVYVVYFWLPTSKTIAENSKKVEAIQKDIDTAKRARDKCKNLEAKLAELSAQKEAAQKKLPTGKKLPDLLRTLTDLSRKYGVSVKSISGGNGPVREEYFMKTTYAVNVSGNYHSIARFLTALGLEERILTMENLVISGGGDALNASFTLIAYQYNG